MSNETRCYLKMVVFVFVILQQFLLWFMVLNVRDRVTEIHPAWHRQN